MLIRLFTQFQTTFPALLMLGLALTCSGNISGFIMLIAALLIHESAHLLTGEFLGYRDNQFHLTPLGGRLRMDPLFALNSETEFLIAVSGPAANWSMVAGVAYLNLLGITHPFLTQWSRMNCLLGSINLIPALPLDGGRILHAGFTRYCGPAKATAGLNIISWLTAALLAVWGTVGLRRGETGSLFIVMTGGWILVHLIRKEKPKIDLSWRLLQHKKRLLTQNGQLPIRPVLVRTDTCVKNALREYGGNEYLIFYIYNQPELKAISEDMAWNSLLEQGFGVTFSDTMKADFFSQLAENE